MVRVEDSVVMNFKVDGLGFRRFKEVVGQYQRWFVYDLGASEVPGLAPLVAEYDGNGNLVAKYHHDGEGLLAMTRNNQSYWYGFEGIGTTRQLMGSQGQVVDAYAFDAWGNELTSPQSQVQNPFKYVGKHGYYLDTESALMLLGVRYYSAANGLFLSRDLIEGYGYTYAVDNPVRWIDPRGLQATTKPPITEPPVTKPSPVMECKVVETIKCEVKDIIKRVGRQCLKLLRVTICFVLTTVFCKPAARAELYPPPEKNDPCPAIPGDIGPCDSGKERHIVEDHDWASVRLPSDFKDLYDKCFKQLKGKKGRPIPVIAPVKSPVTAYCLYEGECNGVWVQVHIVFYPQKHPPGWCISDARPGSKY
jgi:RHS repeat-associated protein